MTSTATIDIARSLEESLMGSDQTAMDRHFHSAGAPPPIIQWAPSIEGLAQPEMRGLLAHWAALRGDRQMPDHDQIDPLDLRDALGHLMILESLDDGEDFRYRVYGSRIAQRTGFDMTGKRVSELRSSPEMGSFFLAGYRAVRARREALLTVHRPPPEISVMRWTRLILPLGDGKGGVARLLVGSMPGALTAPDQ